jgi:hypothetical protein
MNDQFIRKQVAKYPNSVWAELFTRAITTIPKIDAASKSQRIILDKSQDPERSPFTAKAMWSSLTNWLILSGDVNYLDRSVKNIVYYPHFLICSRELACHDSVVINDHAMKYKLSCISAKPRYHRIENYIKLSKKSYFDQLLVSIDKINPEYQFPVYDDVNDIDPAILEEFESLSVNFGSNYHNTYSINDDYFCNSYIHLIAETSSQNQEIFISEKSFKPFRSGQFPIWLGNVNSVKYIRSLGFDVFDDIIDHGYDQELDLHTRIDRIHNEIERLISLDLELLWKQTLNRRLHNRQRLLSDELLIQATAHLHEDLLSIT